MDTRWIRQGEYPSGAPLPWERWTIQDTIELRHNTWEAVEATVGLASSGWTWCKGRKPGGPDILILEKSKDFPANKRERNNICQIEGRREIMVWPGNCSNSSTFQHRHKEGCFSELRRRDGESDSDCPRALTSPKAIWGVGRSVYCRSSRPDLCFRRGPLVAERKLVWEEARPGTRLETETS